MRSSMACSSSVAAAAILFPNSRLASFFEQFGREQPCPAVRSSAAIINGARRFGDGDLGGAVVIRSGVEQGQDRADETAGRHAGQRLDGVGPHALVGRMRQAVEQPDVAPAAQRRLDHQHAPDDPPVAGRQCRRQHLDQFGGSQFRRVAEAAHRRQPVQVMARLPVQRAQVVEQDPPGTPGPDRAERQDGGMRHLRPGRHQPEHRFADGGVAEASQRLRRRLPGFRRAVLQVAGDRPDAAARAAAPPAPAGLPRSGSASRRHRA